MIDPFAQTPLWLIAIVLFAAMFAGSHVGRLLRRRHERRMALHPDIKESEFQEGYLVSAVFGLLALLLGFTFSLSVDRYETRRALVLEEANAIGTAYLRVQLLDEPHRGRMSNLLLDYLDNRIVLGEARHPTAIQPPLEKNDRIVTDLWTATKAAFPTIRDFEFSSTFLDTINGLIDLDAARKTARFVRLPSAVFVMLFAYMTVSSGVLGYVLVGDRGRRTGVFLILLMGLALLLIVDIDRPVLGFIRESQGPMYRLQETLAAQPPEIFDRWSE